MGTSPTLLVFFSLALLCMIQHSSGKQTSSGIVPTTTKPGASGTPVPTTTKKAKTKKPKKTKKPTTRKSGIVPTTAKPGTSGTPVPPTTKPVKTKKPKTKKPTTGKSTGAPSKTAKPKNKKKRRTKRPTPRVGRKIFNVAPKAERIKKADAHPPPHGKGEDIMNAFLKLLEESTPTPQNTFDYTKKVQKVVPAHLSAPHLALQGQLLGLPPLPLPTPTPIPRDLFSEKKSFEDRVASELARQREKTLKTGQEQVEKARKLPKQIFKPDEGVLTFKSHLQPHTHRPRGSPLPLSRPSSSPVRILQSSPTPTRHFNRPLSSFPLKDQIETEKNDFIAERFAGLMNDLQKSHVHQKEVKHVRKAELRAHHINILNHIHALTDDEIKLAKEQQFKREERIRNHFGPRSDPPARHYLSVLNQHPVFPARPTDHPHTKKMKKLAKMIQESQFLSDSPYVLIGARTQDAEAGPTEEETAAVYLSEEGWKTINQLRGVLSEHEWEEFTRHLLSSH